MVDGITAESLNRHYADISIQLTLFTSSHRVNLQFNTQTPISSQSGGYFNCSIKLYYYYIIISCKAFTGLTIRAKIQGGSVLAKSGRGYSADSV